MASLDFTEPDLTLPQPLGENHFHALLSLGELKIIKPISALLLQLGPLGSTLSFLLCFPASLSFILYQLLQGTCDVMWLHSGIFAWGRCACHRIPQAAVQLALQKSAYASPCLHAGRSSLKAGDSPSKTRVSLLRIRSWKGSAALRLKLNPRSFSLSLSFYLFPSPESSSFS